MQPLQGPPTCSSRALMSHRSPQLPWLGGESQPLQVWGIAMASAASLRHPPQSSRMLAYLPAWLKGGQAGRPRCLLHKL